MKKRSAQRCVVATILLERFCYMLPLTPGQPGATLLTANRRRRTAATWRKLAVTQSDWSTLNVKEVLFNPPTGLEIRLWPDIHLHVSFN